MSVLSEITLRFHDFAVSCIFNNRDIAGACINFKLWKTDLAYII